MIINHIPIELIRNPNLINLKENQDITKSIGKGSKIKKVLSGCCLNEVILRHDKKQL